MGRFRRKLRNDGISASFWTYVAHAGLRTLMGDIKVDHGVVPEKRAWPKRFS